jgi:dipeptidyl aminopeptidase/acylaminoacyl peptidase
LAASAALALHAVAAGAAGKRAVTVDDFASLRNVASPDIDPSGTWVAYAVSSADIKADKVVTHVWMSRWDGSASVQLTGRDGESESMPRFSPDGKWLAFISSRDDKKARDQIWLMDRAGGEARRPVTLDGSVVDYAWSPSGRQIALILLDPDPSEAANAKAQAEVPPTPRPGEPGPATAPRQEAAPGDGAANEEKPRPIVIDRFQFKRDIDGYLRGQRQRLVMLDLDSGRTRRLTRGDFDAFLPAWSPDGRRIAFVANRDPDPDRSYNFDLWVVDASADAAEPTRLTAFKGADDDPDTESYPAWSPDGRSIAYLQGGPIELFSYGVRSLAVISAEGGAPQILTQGLDRNIASPTWSPDGRSLSFLVEDDRAQWIGRVPAAGGPIRPVVAGRRVFQAIDQQGARIAVLMTDPATPPEVYALEGGKVRPLSHQNDALLARLDLAKVEETQLRSRDGTEVHGFLIRPPHAPAGRLPTLLRIHGGPQSQYDLGFNFDFQLFAANGYAVVAANPRGSTGRGQDYARAIYAAWGSVDVPDVLAAVDDAVARGIADPDRLGIGGWSYGGMLTNYTIASDPRFKAATSGASISNILAGYGFDQYIRDYEMELGRPWEKPDAWVRVSYPFFHADRIVTPTLFLGGDKDFNVPLIGTEQMYQALKSRGVDTQLVIYPGQFHGLKRPIFLKDRLQRYLDWYGKRLKG